jgi:hypothetical protein
LGLKRILSEKLDPGIEQLKAARQATSTSSSTSTPVLQEPTTTTSTTKPTTAEDGGSSATSSNAPASKEPSDSSNVNGVDDDDDSALVPEWEVADLLATWYRPHFENYMVCTNAPECLNVTIVLWLAKMKFIVPLLAYARYSTLIISIFKSIFTV